MKKYITLNKEQVCIIRKATLDDINEMVILSKYKRLEYEKHQPQF